MFLLTIVCVMFFQRRPDATAMSHSRFEDEVVLNPSVDRSSLANQRLISSDSEEIYKDDDSNDEDDNFESGDEYQTRIIPVETDEIVRSMFVEEESNDTEEAQDMYWINHPRENFHQCSAATCEICENRRQRGIEADQYIRLLQPLESPERIPNNDPNRWFVSGDAVQL